MKATNFLLIIFQAAVIVKSLAYSDDGDNGCQFTYDDSSLLDDSDYHPDGSGDGYEIGDELRLRVHVNNDWELKLSWNASRYEAQAPAYGWSYKVQVTVNATYKTLSGEEKVFTSRSEKNTRNNYETFPLYTPSATYTITVLAATSTKKCLGERLIVSDLPGRQDAVRHFQMRLNFYSYNPCDKKLYGKHERVLSQFTTEIFNALSKERFQQYFEVSLNTSHYQFADLNVACQKENVAIFTGRVIAMGNTSNTQFIKAMETWVSTQPVLPFRLDSVVVNRTCPIYYIPGSEEYCAPIITRTVTPTSTEKTNSDNSNDNTTTTIIIVIAVIFTIFLFVLSLLVCRVSRKRKFLRITSFSFRSQASVSRRLRIDNVLADIESIGNRSPDPDSSTSSELTQSSSHQLSKET